MSKPEIRDLAGGSIKPDPDIIDMMSGAVSALDDELNEEGKNPKYGFALMVFSYGQDGKCHFLSTTNDKENLMSLMRDLLRRFETASGAGHA